MDLPIWETGFYAVAEKEARKILTDNQYAYAVQQIKRLAAEENPRMPKGPSDVKAFGPFGRDKLKFYELREKGGKLGKINLRIFFSVRDESKLIFVMGYWNKKVERRTPNHMVHRIYNRLVNAIETNFRGIRHWSDGKP